MKGIVIQPRQRIIPFGGGIEGSNSLEGGRRDRFTKHYGLDETHGGVLQRPFVSAKHALKASNSLPDRVSRRSAGMFERRVTYGKQKPRFASVPSPICTSSMRGPDPYMVNLRFQSSGWVDPSTTTNSSLHFGGASVARFPALPKKVCLCDTTSPIANKMRVNNICIYFNIQT
jgi:hypothetical protein